MNRMRSRHTPFEVWPGYVDALTSLIMVMIFLLLIFATGQAVLSSTLAGKDRALAAVNARINDLSGVLTRTEAAFRQQTTRLNQVAREAEQSQGEERRLKTELATAMQREIDLNADLASLRLLRQQLETERTQAITQSQTAREMLARQTELNALSALAMATLQQKLDSQEEQLTKISAALDLARKDIQVRDGKLADMDQQLTLALAHQVGKLERYRSEFFGKLRDALGNRTDVRVVGDRFVVPADILFGSGTAELDAEAENRLAQLTRTLQQLMARIPSDIDWVLRVDGHTDRIPIHNERFPSNWELSTARATALVKYFITLGIPAEHLSANGFGEHQPLDVADNSVAHAKNRRIELQLTNR
jgi:chemotaxis protein MotB